MLIVDSALAARAEAGRPIRVGMVGAGFMGRALANQIVNSVPGIILAAISNRHPEAALRAYAEAGVTGVGMASSRLALDAAVDAGRPVVTDDAALLCESERLEALVEVTGAVEFGAGVALKAIENRKHMVLMNAEMDATVGPILAARARETGVVLTACDGDQPGVQMNLIRFVKGIGLNPLVAGNVKGFHDPYRTPETQAEFAARWGQSPYMVTSFADGSKVSFEQALVANGTGFRVATRGMSGREFTGHVDDLTRAYDIEELRDLGGVVDFVVGAKPSPGIYVLASHNDPRQRLYLDLYKLGPGPLYSFYVPYHLCHFEAPFSLARAVLFNDVVLQAQAGPIVEVVAVAKTGLERGGAIDAIGGFLTYGLCENANVVARDGLLPLGVAEGCRLRRSVARDSVLTYDDVELPSGRVVDQLRLDQAEYFGGPPPPD